MPDVRPVSIAGTPAPQGSMTCVGRNGFHQLIADNKPALKSWRKLVNAAGLVLVERMGGRLTEGAVSVELTVTLDRPLTVKLASRRWPWKKSPGHGDVDKLARALLDGLAEAAAYGDDAQVCELHVRKVYPDTLATLDDPDTEPWSWSTKPLSGPGASISIRSIE